MKIPIALFRLPDELFKLYGAIRSFDWEKGRKRDGCTATVETLAEMVGKEKRATQANLNRLEACGAIRIERRVRMPNLIYCTPEAFDPARVQSIAPKGAAGCTPRVRSTANKGAVERTLRVQSVAPEVDTIKQRPEVETFAGQAAPAAAPLVLAAQVAPQKRERKPKDPAPTAAVREAYSEAYAQRYDGHRPAISAKVNGQFAQLLVAIPAADAPAVAAFYVSHNDAFYVRKAHPVGLLLADAPKLHMEWATGQRINAETARQNERTAGNAAWAYAKELEEKERKRS